MAEDVSALASFTSGRSDSFVVGTVGRLGNGATRAAVAPAGLCTGLTGAFAAVSGGAPFARIAGALLAAERGGVAVVPAVAIGSSAESRSVERSATSVPLDESDACVESERSGNAIAPSTSTAIAAATSAFERVIHGGAAACGSWTSAPLVDCDIESAAGTIAGEVDSSMVRAGRRFGRDRFLVDAVGFFDAFVRTGSFPPPTADTSNVQRTRRPARSGGTLMTWSCTAPPGRRRVPQFVCLADLGANRPDLRRDSYRTVRAFSNSARRGSSAIPSRALRRSARSRLAPA